MRQEGKEKYSFIMSKYEPPMDFKKYRIQSKAFWAVTFRQEYRDEFNESYKRFCLDGKIIVRGKELELTRESNEGNSHIIICNNCE